MATAKIYFHGSRQVEQDYGTPDEFMVSRVFFDLEFQGKRFKDLYVDIKQTAGDQFEGGAIEVQSPQGYDGPFNYLAFRDVVESYYRELVGTSGHAIHFEAGSDAIMRNNFFAMPKIASFEIET